MNAQELKIKIAEIEDMVWTEALDVEHRVLCAELAKLERPPKPEHTISEADKQLQRDVHGAVKMLMNLKD